MASAYQKAFFKIKTVIIVQHAFVCVLGFIYYWQRAFSVDISRLKKLYVFVSCKCLYVDLPVLMDRWKEFYKYFSIAPKIPYAVPAENLQFLIWLTYFKEAFGIQTILITTCVSSLW